MDVIKEIVSSPIAKIGIAVGALFIVVLPFLLILIAYFGLGKLQDRNFLVGQIEQYLNLRADIGQVEIGLFSAISGIEIHNIVFAPRDHYANEAIPLEERSEMPRGAIEIEELSLQLSFPALLQRRVEIVSLIAHGARIQLTLYDQGTNLTPLFRTPQIVNGAPNPALEKIEEPPEEEESGPFTIHSLPLAINIGEVGLRNSALNIHIERTGERIRIEPLNLVLHDIDIDPADLENHNQLLAKLDGQLRLSGGAGDDQGLFRLAFNGRLTPFDIESGQFRDDLTLRIDILRDSYLTGFALFDQLAGSLPILRQAGLNLDKVAERAVLTEDVTAHLQIGSGSIRFLEDLRLPTGNYQLALRKDSAINYGNNTHTLRGRLTPTAAESQAAIEKVDLYIRQRIGEEASEGIDIAAIRNELLGNILEDEQITLAFQSLGNLKSPQVQLETIIPTLTEVIRRITGKVVRDQAEQRLRSEIDRHLKDQPGGEAGKQLLEKGLQRLF